MGTGQACRFPGVGLGLTAPTSPGLGAASFPQHLGAPALSHSNLALVSSGSVNAFARAFPGRLSLQADSLTPEDFSFAGASPPLPAPR